MRNKIANVIRNTDQSIIISQSQPKCSLIWLHGLGGQAENYVSFFSHSDSPVHEGCRVKLLQAPKRKVIINQSQCFSWYDIRSLNRFTEPEEKVFNLDHVQQSYNIIQSHFKQEVQFWEQQPNHQKIMANQRIYIGGMSQGGVMSLYYALSALMIPAGVISLSSYLLRTTSLRNLGKLPIFLIHGHNDTVIRQKQARASYARLLSDGHSADYKTIKRLDHSVCLQQIQMIKTWIEGNHEHVSTK